MCQPGGGGRKSCQQAETIVAPTPMPVLPVAELLPGHHPCAWHTLVPQKYRLLSSIMEQDGF